jgi:hypothetical protein
LIVELVIPPTFNVPVPELILILLLVNIVFDRVLPITILFTEMFDDIILLVLILQLLIIL